MSHIRIPRVRSPQTPVITELPAPQESEFQARIVELAQRLDWWHFHVHDSRRSPAGFPDLVLVRPPRLIFAELKTDTGRLSPEQRAWLDLMGHCPGVEVYLWRPVDWDTIVRVLGRRERT